MRLLISIIGLAIIISSCTVKTSYFRSVPPKMELADKYDKILLISAFDTLKLNFNQKDKISVFSNGSIDVLHGLKTGFEKRSNVNAELSGELIRGAALFDKPDTLDLQSRVNYCKSQNYSAMIVVESYDLDFYKDVDVVKEEDGSKTRTATYDLMAEAGIVLYDCDGSIVENSLVRKVHIDYDSRGVISGLLAIGPAMGNAGREVKELSYAIGDEFVAIFYPFDDEIVRNIYNHKSLKPSTQLMINRDWANAIRILQPMTKNTEKKIAGRAAYNLSVAYEALELYEESQFWHDEAKRLLNGKRLPDEVD